MACLWQRKYRKSAPTQGWYILTNLGSLSIALKAYSTRSGIEAMFKDCKTGGYNLEASHTNEKRLLSLILLMVFAYSIGIMNGNKIKIKGIQNYVGRLKEPGRHERRHSTFWIGLYGEIWLNSIDLCWTLVTDLMRLRPNKLPYFQRGLRAMALIQSLL